jgi:hypothetical protein
MIAHLYIPAIDKRANQPTLHNNVTKLLKELKFNGISFTDALKCRALPNIFRLVKRLYSR